MEKLVTETVNLNDGRELFRKVVDDVDLKILDDDEIAPFFGKKRESRDQKLKAVKPHLVRILCVASGEGEYDFKLLELYHHGLGITFHHFKRVLHYLSWALIHNGVSGAETQQLCETVFGLKDLIITPEEETDAPEDTHNPDPQRGNS